MLAFSVGMLNALLYCYFGAMANESYGKMYDCIFELNWYEFPIEQQKYFNLMAANMQRPLHYHGFGVLYLNLDIFTRVRANFHFSFCFTLIICRHNIVTVFVIYSFTIMNFLFFSVIKGGVLVIWSYQNHYIEIKIVSQSSQQKFNFSFQY